MFLFFCTAAKNAASDAPATAKTSGFDYFSGMGQIIWVLFCIILIFVMVYYFTKFYAKRSSRVFASKYITHVDGIVLSKDQYLHLLKIGDKALLISAGIGGVRLVAQFEAGDLQIAEDSEETRYAEAPSDSSLLTRLTFKAVAAIRGYIDKRKASRDKDTSQTDFSSYLRNASNDSEIDPEEYELSDDSISINVDKYLKNDKTKQRTEKSTTGGLDDLDKRIKNRKNYYAKQNAEKKAAEAEEEFDEEL